MIPAPRSDANVYLPLKSLSAYAGLSVRTLRAYLSDRVRPLPHYRIRGKVLVKQSDYDAWAARFRVQGTSASVSSVVEDVVAGILR